MKKMIKILRPCLWFASGDEVEISKFREYFTTRGLKSLIEYGYIKIINDEEQD